MRRLSVPTPHRSVKNELERSCAINLYSPLRGLRVEGHTPTAIIAAGQAVPSASQPVAIARDLNRVPCRSFAPRPRSFSQKPYRDALAIVVSIGAASRPACADLRMTRLPTLILPITSSPKPWGPLLQRHTRWACCFFGGCTRNLRQCVKVLPNLLRFQPYEVQMSWIAPSAISNQALKQIPDRYAVSAHTSTVDESSKTRHLLCAQVKLGGMLERSDRFFAVAYDIGVLSGALPLQRPFPLESRAFWFH